MDISVSRRLVDRESILSHFILHVGGRLNYKNFRAALIGFAGSALPRQGYSIICTGSRFSVEEEQWLKRLDLHDKAFVLEHAGEDELMYLYQHALALVYPSLYEGFGLPVLEAMSCSCPVIAAPTSSIPELVGSAGLLVDCTDPSRISEALNQLLEKEIRDEYVARGRARAKLYGWERTANEHIQIYKSLV
jgi:mannosyltransferase